MSADRILAQLLGSGAAPGFAGGLAGGLAAGLLTSKAGRRLGKKAVKVGGIAALGGLAYAAYSRYRQGSAPRLTADGPEPEPSFERFVPAKGREQQAEALGATLLRAMVAAAHADGKLDGGERDALYERVGALEISETEKAELLAGLAHPVSMSELVAAAETPEVAAEIYAASLLAIEVDTPAERAYLAMLAARLDLPDDLVHSIHEELGLDQGREAPPWAGLSAAS